MIPVRQGDGTGIGEVRLGDGTVIGEIRTGDGQVLYTDSAIPDSAVVQYNAQELTGFSSGESVSTWVDETGNYDASGSGTYLTSDINGYPAVEFDPSSNNSFDAQFSSAISQRVVIFAVTKTDITSQGSNTDLHSVVGAYSNRSWFVEPQTNGDGYNIDAGSSGTQGGTVNSNPTLITAIFDGVNTELREDGTTVIGPTDLGSADWDGLSLGYAPFLGGNTYYDGSIGFVEFHDGNPSNGLATREQEVANMWDITL